METHISRVSIEALRDARATTWAMTMICDVMTWYSSNVVETAMTIVRAINRKLAASVGSVRASYRGDETSGVCTLCGSYGLFRRAQVRIRESYECESCGASARERHQAEVILDRFSRHGSRSIKALAKEPEFPALAVYELTQKGRFCRYLAKLPNYTHSYYWDDVPPGEHRGGLQCQDVMSLTYTDGSFDLIISSDVFEHVRRPLLGFKEIARVLKQGGIHCWTVPALHPVRRKTVYKVDTSGSTDVFIDPPHYHTDEEGGKSLVYTEFGTDILKEIQELGMDTEVVRAPSQNENIARVITFLSVKRSAG